MGIKVKLNGQFYVTDIERDDKVPDWIEKHKQANQGKLPTLPDFLVPLTNINSDGWRPCIKGQRISQDIQVIPVSGQQWQLMTASERAELLELVEWTGVNAEDYCREFQSHFPRDPDFSRRKQEW